MANLGPRSSKHLVILTGWDATQLELLKLEDGTTYQAVVGLLTAGLAGVVGEFVNSWYSSLLYFTPDETVEYRVGSSNGFARYTEYSRSDPQRADTEGHMLPLVPYDRSMQWTWEYLRKARTTQIQADIADGLKDIRDLLRQQVLGRVLQRGDDSGTGDGLGTGGYSPGFCTTAGSTNVDFRPPDYNGTVFANTHEHYVGISGGVFTNAVFTDARSELMEHGHNPPFEFVIGTSDQATVEALSAFTPVAEMNVNYGATQDLAKVSSAVDLDGSYYIGTHSDFLIRVVRGIPQYYGAGWKSYGRNSQRNPLWMRVAKTQPMASQFGVVAMPDPEASNGSDPLNNLMMFTEFGVGVGDRTACTPRYVNSASWSDGTVT